ncbi:MAG: hypothetical protein DRI81_07170 [Chloroflexi bacterium]|nr:MAG: hypothetical protein DRI81_07170 [Chloroflexota bacterium]
MKTLERIAETLTGNIKPLDDIAGAFESMVLALTGPVASWAASIPNVVMVARSGQQIFALDAGLSYAVAVSLEFIGQSLVSNWTRAAQWQATKKAGDLPARVGLAKGLMVGYFLLDIVMVGTLAYTQYAASGQWQIFTALIYPVISIFTAIATNQRAHLFRLEKQSEQTKREQAQKRQEARQAKRQKAGKKATIEPATQPATVPHYATIKQSTQEQAAVILAQRSDISGAELGRLLGKSASLGRQLKRKLSAETDKDNGHIVGQNGHSSEVNQ